MVTRAGLAMGFTGLLVFVALFVLLRGPFSAAARARRRRDRSHGPVISRKRRPTVKLAVKVGEPKRKLRR